MVRNSWKAIKNVRLAREESLRYLELRVVIQSYEGKLAAYFPRNAKHSCDLLTPFIFGLILIWFDLFETPSNKKDTFLRNKLVTDKDLVHSSNKNGEEDFYETLDTSTVLKNRLKKLIYVTTNQLPKLFALIWNGIPSLVLESIY